jgi:DNA uptake protein ComE-like DNA-binding protein
MKFFYLQKSDRRVILALLCIAIVSLVAVFFFIDDHPDEGRLKQVEKPRHVKESKQPKQYIYSQGEQRKPELFPFDPNTADSTQLLRLGLQPWQVVNIYKYRKAGGVYRKPHDFARLYGLTVKQYRQLEPYIRISEDYRPSADYYSKDEVVRERDTVKYPVKLQPGEQISLNSADTSQLRKVPGIGSYYARKIVAYRERLGGYCRVEQLLEIENFPEAAVAYFTVSDHPRLQKLNLNRLSQNELKRHPYINYYQAREIVDYRRLHGRLESLQQLSLLKDFPKEAIERLEPYVEF